MSDNNQITKVYDIQTIGGKETYNQLDKINNLFKEMAKNKVALGTINFNVDSSKLNDVAAGFNNLIKSNKDLLDQVKILTSEMGRFGQVGQKITTDVADGMNKMNMATVKNTEGFVKMTGSIANAREGAAGYEEAVNTLGARLAYLKLEQEAISASIKLLNADLQKGQITQEEYGESIGVLTTNLSQTKTQINEVSGAMTTMNKLFNPALLEEENIALAENRLELQQRTRELKLNAVAEAAQAGSLKEARANAALYREELQNLNLTTDEGKQKQIELIGTIDELDAFIKANSEAYTRQKINIGNYPQLTVEAEALKEKMAELTAEGKSETEAFKELEVESLRLAAAMKSANGPSSGLNSIVTPTFQGQLRAVKTEMYAMAEAGQADTEQFRILAEEAKRLEAAILQVEAAVNGASQKIDRFGSIVERMGLRMLANILIFQAAMELIEAFGTEFKNSMSVVNAEQEAAASMAKETANNFSAEAASVMALKARFEDLSSTESDKLEVVEELNDKFGTQIDKINGVSDAERFFVDKSDAFIKALNLRAEATAAMNVITQQYQKQLEALSDPAAQLNWFEKMGAGLAAGGKNIKTIAGMVLPVNSGKSLDDIGDDYDWEKIARGAGKADQTIQATNAQIAFLIKQFIQLQNEAQKIDSQFGFNTDKKGGKDKKGATPKEPHDYTNARIDAEKKLTNFLAKEQEARLHIEMDEQAEIFNNTEAALQDRLKAYAIYARDLKGILQIQKDAEIRDVQDKLNRISDIEKAVADKKAGRSYNKSYFGKDGSLRPESETLLINKDALNAQLNYVNTEYKSKLLQAQDTINNGIAAIARSGLDKQLKDIDQDLNKKIADIEEKGFAAKAKIYGSGASGEVKDQQLNKVDLAENVETDQANVDANAKQQQQLQEDVDELRIQSTHNTAMLALEMSYQAKLLDVKKKGIELQGKLNADNYKKDVDDKSTSDAVKKEIEQQAFQVAQSFANEYMELLAKEDQYREAMSERQLNWNKKQQDSQTESKAQASQDDKAYALAQQQAEKQKMEDDKKRAETQATINYATAVMGIIAGNAKLGIAAIPIDAVQIAAATAAYGLNMGLIASSPTFEHGGDVPKNGGIFGGKLHSAGGTPFFYGGGSFEAEKGELAIINRRSAASNDNMTVTGTPKQIASAVNSYGGGYNFAPGGKMFKFEYGGSLGRQIEPPSFISDSSMRQIEYTQSMGGLYKMVIANNETLHKHAEVLSDHTQALMHEAAKPVILNPHHVTDYQKNYTKSVQLGTL